MKRTRVCDLLDIDYPIVQAPMLWITWAELAAAVSSAGGLGTIGLNSGATASTRDLNVLGERLRSQIRQVRSLSDKPFAVNVLVMQGSEDPYSDEFVKVMIEEQVPVAVVAGDNPLVYTERLKQAGVKVLHRFVNPTVVAAKEAENAGADAIVIVGFDGGGHLGLEMLSNLVLVPQVVDAVRVPVIAGGGIADARGMMAAFVLGAEGVYMGTRFIATKECNAHLDFKQAIVDASETSTVTFRGASTILRSMKNPLSEKALRMQADGAPIGEIERKVFAGRGKAAMLDGDLANGAGFFSPSAGLRKSVISVKELMQDLATEYDRIRDRL